MKSVYLAIFLYFISAFYIITAAAGLIAGRIVNDTRSAPAPAPLPRLPLVPEVIVRESLSCHLPPHLTLALAWQESRFDPWAIRHESNKTWSVGIFQINSHEPLTIFLDSGVQIRQGLNIVDHWWRKSGGDWTKTIHAYRTGHLTR